MTFLSFLLFFLLFFFFSPPCLGGLAFLWFGREVRCFLSLTTRPGRQRGQPSRAFVSHCAVLRHGNPDDNTISISATIRPHQARSSDDAGCNTLSCRPCIPPSSAASRIVQPKYSVLRTWCSHVLVVLQRATTGVTNDARGGGNAPWNPIGFFGWVFFL